MQNEKIEADIVVAGAGHNSLITAAYLAKAGKKVVVVDARRRPGGGVDTEELIPDFWVDSCSTGHTLLRSNPLIQILLPELHFLMVNKYQCFLI